MMEEPRYFPDWIESKYDDRGGWKGLIHLFKAKLPYEVRMQNVKDQYRVSIGTAKEWYGKWRSMIGVK